MGRRTVIWEQQDANRYTFKLPSGLRLEVLKDGHGWYGRLDTEARRIVTDTCVTPEAAQYQIAKEFATITNKDHAAINEWYKSTFAA